VLVICFLTTTTQKERQIQKHARWQATTEWKSNTAIQDHTVNESRINPLTSGHPRHTSFQNIPNQHFYPSLLQRTTTTSNCSLNFSALSDTSLLKNCSLIFPINSKQSWSFATETRTSQNILLYKLIASKSKFKHYPAQFFFLLLSLKVYYI